jgi:hypothetical protein
MMRLLVLRIILSNQAMELTASRRTIQLRMSLTH